VIPTLVMVEVWHWTPLVMLIVLGGLAGLRAGPTNRGDRRCRGGWHMFRFITLPLLWPYIMIALIIRTMRTLKVFDIIFVISEGGPGTASRRSTSSSICRRSSSTRSATHRRWW